MKYNTIKTYYSNCYWLFLLIMISCSKPNQEKSIATVESISNETAPTKVLKEFYINNPQNEMLATITLDGDETIVKTGGMPYFGVLKRTDKRKYFDQSDALAYTVKYSETGYKIRNANEELLWKVKISEDHIKLANNEEMENPYRIGWSGDNKIKVKQGEQELGAIRLESNSKQVAIGEKYLLINYDGSLAPGILLIQEIPEKECFFICAELVRLAK